MSREILAKVLIQLPAMAVLLGLSAFFSGTETAFFSIGHALQMQMKSSSHASERRVGWLLDRKRGLLISILFGNMIVNILFFSLTYVLSVTFFRAGYRSMGPAISVLGVILVVIFGEVSPKAVAVHFPKRVALLSAYPIYLVYAAASPVRWVMSVIVALSARISSRLSTSTHHFTNDQMRAVLKLGRRHGTLRPEQESMLGEVLDLSEMEVREIMVPRVEAPLFDLANKREDLVALIREERPKVVVAYRGTIDHTEGIIHAKDVFLFPDRPMDSLVRKAPYVPETKPLDELLREMRDLKQSIAIVVDEYGGTEGLVTVEHLVEEIVGEIKHEYEEEQEEVIQLGEDTWSLDGGLPAHELEELFGLDVDHDEFSTVAGMVLYLLGRFPTEGETLTYRGFVITVLRIRNHRIERVKVTRASGEEAE